MWYTTRHDAIEKEGNALSSSFKDSPFQSTAHSSLFGDSLAASSISLHERKGERQYVTSWTKGGLDDALNDDDDADPNLDSYARVAGRFQLAKYLTGKNRNPKLTAQVLRLDPSGVNSLPAITKTTGTNQSSPYKQFQGPDVVQDHLSINFPESIKAMYKQSANSNKNNPASGNASIASFGAQGSDQDDDSTHFSVQEMLQTTGIVESWEKNRGLGFYSAGEADKTGGLGLDSKPHSRMSNSRQKSASNRKSLIQFDTIESTDASLLPTPLPRECKLEVICYEDLTNGDNNTAIGTKKNLTIAADVCTFNDLKKIVKDCSLWRAMKNNEQGQRWNGRISCYSNVNGWKQLTNEDDWILCKLSFRERHETIRIVYYVSSTKKSDVLPNEETEKILKPNQVIYTNHLSYGKVDEKLNMLYLMKPRKSKVREENSHKVSKQLALAGELEQKLIRTRW